MKHCMYMPYLMLIAGMAGWSITARGTTNMADDRDPIPFCVGRLVTNLPADTKPKVRSTFQYMEVQAPKPVASFDVIKQKVDADKKLYVNKAMNRSAYDDRLERAAGFDPDKTYGKDQLIGVQIDGATAQAVIAYHPDLDSTGIVTKVSRFLDGMEYTFQTKDAGADDYPATRNAMWNAALHFQPLSRSEVPTTPGFCVAGGMFADAGKPPLHEGFTLVVSFKNHPDARFVIDGHAIAKVDTDEPSLKHRVDSELGILRSNVEGHVSVLVRGEREAAGQKGFQIGLSVPNDTVEGTTAYKFFWAADGIPDDASRPAMEVSLTIQPNDDKPASFADARQAEALWNELLQGLRIRPGSVAR